jgi:uncharacterized protein DUF6589
MRNMTTALLVTCPYLPQNRLTQDMFHPEKLLSYKDLIEAPGLRRDSNISIYFITEAVAKLHSTEVAHVFNDTSYRPQMPEIDRLRPYKTVMHQLGAIYEDEGTIEGTYGVHKDIWIKKLGFAEPDSSRHFARRLWLVWGDQKTAHHIRSVKAEQRLASRKYDRRDWMIGPGAFFHVLQSFLFLMVRTHWENPQGKPSKATLLHDIGYWNRYGITRDNAKFHLLQPLVMQGFTARVLALWYDVLSSRGHF